MMKYESRRVPNLGVRYVNIAPPTEFHKLKSDWHEFQDEEQYELDTEKQAIAQLRDELTAIYESADPFLQLQFKGIKEHVATLLEDKKFNTAMLILQSPHIPENVQPIADTIKAKLDEFIATLPTE